MVSVFARASGGAPPARVLTSASSAGLKRATGQDVASKSLSDLESLVDQIPSIAEGGGQRLQQGHGHLSEEALAEKLEAGAQQGYLSGYGGAGPNPNYSPPLSGGHYAEGYASPGYGMPPRHGQPDAQQHSKSYTVENLASSNYTPSGHHGAYPGPHYPVPMAAGGGGGSANGYLFGGLDSSLMQRPYAGMASHHHPSLHHHMANAYPYNSSPYGGSYDGYSAPSPSNPGLHSPQASYQPGYQPAGSPGGSSTPPAYLQQPASRPPAELAYDAA